MITTSFESPKIGKETHYLKMGVGDENIWRTLYVVNILISFDIPTHPVNQTLMIMYVNKQISCYDVII